MKDGIVTAPADCAAGLARGYTNNGFTDWFLPSQVELNVMCNYSRNPTTPAVPTVLCAGVQNGTFAGGAFEFDAVNYWFSSQNDADSARGQGFDRGTRGGNFNSTSTRNVRSVRAF